jgi:hypothetical protein
VARLCQEEAPDTQTESTPWHNLIWVVLKQGTKYVLLGLATGVGLCVVPGVPVGIGIGMYLANKFDKQHPEQIDKGSYKVHVYHPMNHDCPMEDDWQHMEQKLIARAPGKALNGIVQDYQGNAQLILVEEARSDTGALLFYKPVRIETFREIQRRVDEIQGRVDELIHPAETDRLA